MKFYAISRKISTKKIFFEILCQIAHIISLLCLVLASIASAVVAVEAERTRGKATSIPVASPSIFCPSSNSLSSLVTSPSWHRSKSVEEEVEDTSAQDSASAASSGILWPETRN